MGSLEEELPQPSHDAPVSPSFLVGVVWEPCGRLPTCKGLSKEIAMQYEGLPDSGGVCSMGPIRHVV